jgi:translation initiation factor IF-2
MSVATSKVRLYDLAKELKIDTKRLIEEVRREGVDVSVPSNSVSKELAEKIREKYFPKQPTTAKRAIKIVKKAARVIEEPPPVEEPPIDEAPIEAEAPAPEPIPVAEPEEPAKPQVTRVIKKLAPAARAPEPEAESTPAQIVQPQAEATEPAAEPAPTPQPAPPPGRQVRVLRPTAAALSQGIRPGERAPAPAPAITPARERNVRRVEYSGTPGETATPQTTYIPPPDAGRRRSRRSAPRGGKRAADGKGKLDRDYIAPPEVRTLEERIAGRLQMPSDASELKPVRLVEGSTVKEFAEKLGIKPKDVVTLLLQRGVFATINQGLER